jgi:hypothetical protein
MARTPAWLTAAGIATVLVIVLAVVVTALPFGNDNPPGGPSTASASTQTNPLTSPPGGTGGESPTAEPTPEEPPSTPGEPKTRLGPDIRTVTAGRGLDLDSIPDPQEGYDRDRNIDVGVADFWRENFFYPGAASLGRTSSTDWQTCSTISAGFSTRLHYNELKVGDQFCLITTEGRRGWLKIAGVQQEASELDSVTIEYLVWEKQT